MFIVKDKKLNVIVGEFAHLQDAEEFVSDDQNDHNLEIEEEPNVSIDSKEAELRNKIIAGEDITACVALYLNLFEDTDVMHRDVVENEIEELRHGNEENCMEAGRLELMLQDNPDVTYFDYYKEKPITFEWLRERFLMPRDSGPNHTLAIEVLTDHGFGQDLTTVLVACACRNALDEYEEKTQDLPFEGFCRTVEDLWGDCDDRTDICVIADWLVQWHIRCPDEDWPGTYRELMLWAQSEGL